MGDNEGRVIALLYLGAVLGVIATVAYQRLSRATEASQSLGWRTSSLESRVVILEERTRPDHVRTEAPA